MASDLTPEEIAGLRKTLDSGHFVLLGEDGYRLLDMTERCAKAEAEVAKLRERQE